MRAEDRVEEAARLVASAGAEVVEVIRGRRDRPDAATFAGSGKVDEIRMALREHGAEVVVFDQQLSAGQVRNLERQRGSLGKTGGPGEKQIELDRRMIGERVKKLREKIRKVGKVRATQRAGRSRSGVLRVALVGYTNAGKSTLFNRIARSGAYVADQLFATLDTTTRRVYLGEAASITLSDTVGFIRDLPHSLVDAFRATLEETIQADLLLHVVDSAAPQREDQIAAVNEVLGEIDAADVPQIVVYNQIDRVPGLVPEVVRDACGKILNIKVSAATGAGIEPLREALAEAAREAGRGSLATAA